MRRNLSRFCRSGNVRFMCRHWHYPCGNPENGPRDRCERFINHKGECETVANSEPDSVWQNKLPTKYRYKKVMDALGFFPDEIRHPESTPKRIRHKGYEILPK